MAIFTNQWGKHAYKLKSGYSNFIFNKVTKFIAKWNKTNHLRKNNLYQYDNIFVKFQKRMFAYYSDNLTYNLKGKEIIIKWGALAHYLSFYPMMIFHCIKTFNYYFIRNFLQQFFFHKADNVVVHKIITNLDT